MKITDQQQFARLDKLVEPLADFPILGLYGALPKKLEVVVEKMSRQLNAVCFTEPGIGNPQYADRAALTPAQLEPARQFRRWAVARLAATNWAEARPANTARVLWEFVLGHWSFMNWGMATLLPDEDSGLAAVLDKLLQGPNLELALGVPLSTVLQKMMQLDMQFPGPAREAMRLLLPRLLRFGPGHNVNLRDLALHPEAAEEVPRLLHDIFAEPALLAHYWGYVKPWLEEAPVVKLLKPALPRLRHYLGLLTQPQLAELVRLLNIKAVSDENLAAYDELNNYAKSPNRLALLALLAELATEPALAALTQAGLAQAQARRQALAAQRPPRKSAKRRQLADFNLKLLVVSQLIRQGDAPDELDEILDLDRDPDDDTFAPLPAALAAYRRLRLTQAQFDAVEVLELDGSDIVDLCIINNWQSSDGQFDVQSLEGISLLRNLRVFNPISMLATEDFTPLLDCPKLEEAKIADWAGADSEVVLALEARGVRVM